MSNTRAANQLERLADGLGAGARRAVTNTAETIRGAAVERSSGGLDVRTLRKERPYARRHGAPKRDPRTVNVGATGDFRAGWQTDPVSMDAGNVVAAVFNADPKAGYLEQRTPPPTRATMLARPVDEGAVEDAGEDLLERNLGREMGRVFGR